MYEKQGHFRKPTTTVDNCGLHLELDNRYVRLVLEKFDVSQANAILSSGNCRVVLHAIEMGRASKETGEFDLPDYHSGQKFYVTKVLSHKS